MGASALVGLWSVGCSLSAPESDKQGDPVAEEGGTLDEGDRVASTVRPGREIRLDAVMDRVHFAFKAKGKRFEARHSTHSVSVDRGVLYVTPHHRMDDRVMTGAPIELETTAIYRGDAAIDVNYRGAAIDAETGRLRVERGELTEELKNFEGGVEQSWRFERAPGEDGDLVVEVAAVGHAYVASTERGLHFATPGKLGFRYSHALWIGADGQEVAVNVEHVDGSIRIAVPADVVASTTFPAVLDPTVEAETAVDTPVNGWTGAGSRRVQIARNTAGTQFLVVWQDDRNGVESDIFGTFIDASGAVLRPDGISISEDSGIQDNPTVAFSNGRYVVAWQDTGNIAAARVSTTGAVTALGNIAATAANEILPELVTRGATALLVYQSDLDVRGLVFNGLTFGATFPIANSAEVEADPTVAANPDGDYLVAWTEGATTPNVRGRLVTAGGAPNGAVFDISVATGGQSQPAAAFKGTDFVVAFANNDNGADIYGTRVSTAGVVLDTRPQGMGTVGGVPISTAAGTQNQPDVACNATSCLVAWTDRRNVTANGFDVFGQVVNNDFTLNGAAISLAAFLRDQRAPGLVTSGTGWIAGWHDGRHGGADAAFAARIAADGSITDPTGVLLATGNNREGSPTIAENANNWLVAWSDSRELGADIRGVRVRFNGTNLDASSRPISTAPAHQSSPDATRLGARWLVVWQDARDEGGDDNIFAGRVEATGAPTDPDGIAITTAAADQITPEVASDGSNALIVWADRRNGSFDIFGAMIDVNGDVTAVDIPICVINGDQFRPSVAYDPTNAMYLVAWSDLRSGTPDVFGARVDAAGNVLDANGVLISGAAGAQNNPDVTFGGGRFFVTWEDRRNDSAGDIFGARVNAAAAGISVLDVDGIAVATAAGSQTEPVVVFAQNSYILAWTDGRDFGLNSTDVYGGQVSLGGVAQPNYVISATTETESVPAMSTSGEGTPNLVLIAYSRRVGALDTSRIFHRRITSGTTNGQPCGGSSGCESGFCVEGVCCDTACGGSSSSDCQACSTARGAAVNGTCGPVAAGRICRNYATVFCDRRELCDGASIACPDDVGRREGQVCNSTTMTVCPANDVSGAPHFCP